MALLAATLALARTPPPSGSVYFLTFTAVRGGLDVSELQLAEVMLYGVGGEPLSVVEASNPGGVPFTWWEHAPSAVDGDLATKWLDMNITKGGGRQSSTLLLSLASATPVGSYDLYTANHEPKRDPVSWTFGISRGDGSDEALHAMARYEPAFTRRTSYTHGARFTVLTPFPAFPPPPAPPSPPAPPQEPHWLPIPPAAPRPAAPPPLSAEYAFLFTRARGGLEVNGLQLAEVTLYGVGGEPLSVLRASNPGGVPGTWWESASAVIDGSLASKWLDTNFSFSTSSVGAANQSTLRRAARSDHAAESFLLLTLASATPVVSYDLFTASQNPTRDPTEWSFGAKHGDTFEPLHRVTSFRPPFARQSSYVRCWDSNRGCQIHTLLNPMTGVSLRGRQMAPSLPCSTRLPRGRRRGRRQLRQPRQPRRQRHHRYPCRRHHHRHCRHRPRAPPTSSPSPPSEAGWT